MSVEHLRNLASAYAISSPEISATMSAEELREQIVNAARQHFARSTRELGA
jgi:hypothetical protein